MVTLVAIKLKQVVTGWLAHVCPRGFLKIAFVYQVSVCEHMCMCVFIPMPKGVSIYSHTMKL